MSEYKDFSHLRVGQWIKKTCDSFSFLKSGKWYQISGNGIDSIDVCNDGEHIISYDPSGWDIDNPLDYNPDAVIITLDTAKKGDCSAIEPGREMQMETLHF